VLAGDVMAPLGKVWDRRGSLKDSLVCVWLSRHVLGCLASRYDTFTQLLYRS